MHTRVVHLNDLGKCYELQRVFSFKFLMSETKFTAV